LSKFDEPYWKKFSDLNTKFEKKEALAAKLFEQNRKKEYEQVWAQVLEDENYFRQRFPLEYIREFATKNPSTFISAYKLLGVYDLRENYNAYLNIYNGLNNDVKQHKYGLMFKEKLDAIAKITDGKPFPKVAGQSLKGEKYDYPFGDKKIVFVDFWASWCIPCREANPELVDLYKRYHPKGFDVISISFDTDQKLWNAAVAKDNLIWPNHFSDLIKFGESANNINFDVGFIPQNYVLDHTGKILSRNVEIDSLKTMLNRISD
jgi:thiol-disulfide isomerase/thioredoxin